MDESRLVIGAVLLAAGEGSRMGGVPKCLLSLAGVPLIHRHVQAMREAGVTEIVIVTGYHYERIEPAIGSAAVKTVRNPHPEQGQHTSVRIGIEALEPGCDLVIIALADQPMVGSAELAELIVAFRSRAGGTQILYPRVEGKRGNPVLCSGELIRSWISSGEHVALRKFIDDHPELVQVHETLNPHFILDLDTRDDIEAFQQRTGMTLTMPTS